MPSGIKSITPRIKPRLTPKDEIITRKDIYLEIGRRTGYMQQDIEKVIKTFHEVLADEFTSGKTFFRFRPYYSMIVQEYAGRMQTLKGKTRWLPSWKKIKFRPGAALNYATGHENEEMRSRRLKRKKGRK